MGHPCGIPAGGGVGGLFQPAVPGSWFWGGGVDGRTTPLPGGAGAWNQEIWGGGRDPPGLRDQSSLTLRPGISSSGPQFIWGPCPRDTLAFQPWHFSPGPGHFSPGGAGALRDRDESIALNPTFPIWLKSFLSNSSMVFQPLSNYGPFLRVPSYNNSMICHFAVRCRKHHGGT